MVPTDDCPQLPNFAMRTAIPKGPYASLDFDLPIARNVCMITATSSAGVASPSSVISGLGGGSYGEEIPVKSLISPCRAFLVQALHVSFFANGKGRIHEDL